MIKLLILFFFALTSHAAYSTVLQLDKLKLPAGWKLGIYASAVPGARSLTQGPDGVVFVGSQDRGKVYALLPDKDGDGKSDGIKVIARGLDTPNGVAYKNGDLYIAEVNRILLVKGISKDLDHPAKPSPWGPSFPNRTHHGWKFIAFGPDGWLYVPVGAPCNVCEEDPKIFAAIHRVSPDGTKRELVAQGVRNTVGFDWSPAAKDLWFTDNGRDLLGDDAPADELNHVTKKNTVQHFGFPYCHAAIDTGNIPDPEFGKGKDCNLFTSPETRFPAHVAALGMRFLRNQKNAAMNGNIVVALHGSWNHSTPQGYELRLVKFAQGKAQPSEVFLTGFLQGTEAWGRPVDVLELKDGSMLVSDDKAGAVYRLYQ